MPNSLREDASSPEHRDTSPTPSYGAIASQDHDASPPVSHDAGEQAQDARRPGRLSLPMEMPLRQGLSTAFAEIVGFACSQIGLAASDPVTALHEYRKAVRRARALVRLARGFLPDDAYTSIAQTLRTAHRATSAQRDRHVVLHALDTIELSRAAKEPADSVRASLGSEAPAAEESAVELLTSGATLLQPLPQAFDQALPDKVKWRHVAEGLQVTYARARRDMDRAKASGDDEALHEWRKRTKELTYQVELLTAEMADGRIPKQRQELSKLAEKLGEIMDLMVLETYVKRHGGESEQKPLIADIRAHKQKRLKKVLERGAKIYERKPKGFAVRVARATRAAHKKAAAGAKGAKVDGKGNGVVEAAPGK